MDETMGTAQGLPPGLSPQGRGGGATVADETVGMGKLFPLWTWLRDGGEGSLLWTKPRGWWTWSRDNGEGSPLWTRSRVQGRGHHCVQGLWTIHRLLPWLRLWDGWRGRCCGPQRGLHPGGRGVVAM